MKPEILRLNLLGPLLYAPSESIALAYKQEDGEKLFCFEIEESQAQEFLPEKRHFPGALVFSGKALKEEEPSESILELPSGNYIFCQIREILDEDGIIDLAVEAQNEGLWQRLKLTKRLYVRFLFEESQGVTQIWRPYTE